MTCTNSSASMRQLASESDPEDDTRTHALHSSYYAAQLEQWGEKIASPRTDGNSCGDGCRD